MSTGRHELRTQGRDTDRGTRSASLRGGGRQPTGQASLLQVMSGAFLFMVGLVIMFTRYEIVVKIFGRWEVWKDRLVDGGSTDNTIILLTLVSVLMMVVGAIMLLMGIMQSKNQR